MKFRMERNLNRLVRTLDVASIEAGNEVAEFIPERDIPTEIQQQSFSNLEFLGEHNQWISYIELYNSLAVLFPEKIPAKKVLSEKKLLISWNNNLLAGIYSDIPTKAYKAAEVRSFGLSIDHLFSKEETERFLAECDQSLYHRYVGTVFSNHLLALRLGLRTREQAFSNTHVAWADIAWNMMLPLLQNCGTDFNQFVTTLTQARLLFPEKKSELSGIITLEQIEGAKKIAEDYCTKMLPTVAALIYTRLALCTASELSLGKNGEFIIGKTVPPITQRLDLPTRPLVG